MAGLSEEWVIFSSEIDSEDVDVSHVPFQKKLCKSIFWEGAVSYSFFIWVCPKIWENPPNHPFFIGVSIINHPFWGLNTPIFGNTHMGISKINPCSLYLFVKGEVSCLIHGQIEFIRVPNRRKKSSTVFSVVNPMNSHQDQWLFLVPLKGW